MDTLKFLHRFKNISIDKKVKRSFDVRGLFTNILVDFPFNCILENIFTNGIKDFYRLSKLQLKKLPHWTTKRTVFQFQELYKQTDGVAMGSQRRRQLREIGGGGAKLKSRGQSFFI